MWLNQDNDILNIGEEALERFRPFAFMIFRLRMECTYDEHLYNSGVDELAHFVNIKEIHIVCMDGLFSWLGAFEDSDWICGEDNVSFIDPWDERVYKGLAGIAELRDDVSGPLDG